MCNSVKPVECEIYNFISENLYIYIYIYTVLYLEKNMHCDIMLRVFEKCNFAAKS
jgi:hypothetical protein